MSSKSSAPANSASASSASVTSASATSTPATSTPASSVVRSVTPPVSAKKSLAEIAQINDMTLYARRAAHSADRMPSRNDAAAFQAYADRIGINPIQSIS